MTYDNNISLKKYFRVTKICPYATQPNENFKGQSYENIDSFSSECLLVCSSRNLLHLTDTRKKPDEKY